MSLDALPPAFPILADPSRGQNFPERTHPALAPGLLAAPGAGPAGRRSLGDAPTLLSEASLPFLLFVRPGSPGDPIQSRHPSPTPAAPQLIGMLGVGVGWLVVLASHQGTLLGTPEGPGLRPGSLPGATTAEILSMPLVRLQPACPNDPNSDSA